MDGESAPGQGFFYRDVRHLSRFNLRIDGEELTPHEPAGGVLAGPGPGEHGFGARQRRSSGRGAAMKLNKAIEDVLQAESGVAKALRVTRERHAVEHDLYHLGHTRAKECEEHLSRLGPFAERYGTPWPNTDGVAESPGLVESLRHKSAELLGRSEPTGMLLLHDLRDLYLRAPHRRECVPRAGRGAREVAANDDQAGVAADSGRRLIRFPE